MKKVLVFGTFDIFHQGHSYFLKQAKKYGDFLCVVVARDETVEKFKKQKPVNNEVKRMSEIEKSDLADEVVLGNLQDKYLVVKKYLPDVICLGYDQNFFIENLQDKLNDFGLEKTKIIRIDAYKPKIFKSSLLRKMK